MTAPDYPDGGGDFFAVVPLQTDEHAASVEAADGMVRMVIMGPVVVTTVTLNRSEARELALLVVDASQRIEGDD